MSRPRSTWSGPTHTCPQAGPPAASRDTCAPKVPSTPPPLPFTLGARTASPPRRVARAPHLHAARDNMVTPRARPLGAGAAAMTARSDPVNRRAGCAARTRRGRGPAPCSPLPPRGVRGPGSGPAHARPAPWAHGARERGQRPRLQGAAEPRGAPAALSRARPRGSRPPPPVSDGTAHGPARAGAARGSRRAGRVAGVRVRPRPFPGGSAGAAPGPRPSRRNDSRFPERPWRRPSASEGKAPGRRDAAGPAPARPRPRELTLGPPPAGAGPGLPSTERPGYAAGVRALSRVSPVGGVHSRLQVEFSEVEQVAPRTGLLSKGGRSELGVHHLLGTETCLSS